MGTAGGGEVVPAAVVAAEAGGQLAQDVLTSIVLLPRWLMHAAALTDPKTQRNTADTEGIRYGIWFSDASDVQKFRDAIVG